MREGALEMKGKHASESVESGYAESDTGGGCGCWRLFLVLLNTLNHALVILVTGYLVYLSYDYSNTTDLHVLLCTLGYVLLMAEAIVVLTGENLWTSWMTRRSNSHLHWILQVVGTILNVAGVVVMYIRHKQHFRSIHGLTGIISVGGIAVLFISGLPALYAARLRKLVRPVIGKFLHNFLGIICFVVGMASQCYGYKKGWLRSKGASEMANVLIVTTAMITVLSLIGSLRSLYEQFKGLFKCR